MMPYSTIPAFLAGVMLLIWAVPLLSVPLWAQEAGAALETGKFGAWLVHQNAGDGPKICFAASQPTIKEPAGANRSRIVLYVSAWPKEGVKSEVSVKLGYPVKPDGPVAVTVGTESFELFAKDDRAYVADPTEELKLVEAMKKGATLIVQATSTKGTQTKDTYSLQGVQQALQAIATACP